MLQDPEYFEDAAIEVAAQDEAEAQRKGERIAALRSDAQTLVKCLGCRKRTRREHLNYANRFIVGQASRLFT